MVGNFVVKIKMLLNFSITVTTGIRPEAIIPNTSILDNLYHISEDKKIVYFPKSIIDKLIASKQTIWLRSASTIDITISPTDVYLWINKQDLSSLNESDLQLAKSTIDAFKKSQPIKTTLITSSK